MYTVLRSKVSKRSIAELRKFLRRQKPTLGKLKRSDFKKGFWGTPVIPSKRSSRPPARSKVCSSLISRKRQGRLFSMVTIWRTQH